MSQHRCCDIYDRGHSTSMSSIRPQQVLAGRTRHAVDKTTSNVGVRAQFPNLANLQRSAALDDRAPARALHRFGAATYFRDATLESDSGVDPDARRSTTV